MKLSLTHFLILPSDILNTSLAWGEIAFCCRLRMRPSTPASSLLYIYTPGYRPKRKVVHGRKYNSLQCSPASCVNKKMFSVMNWFNLSLLYAGSTCPEEPPSVCLSEATVSLVEAKLMEADRLKMCGMMWLKEHETCSPMDAVHRSTGDTETIKCWVFLYIKHFHNLYR